MSVPLWTADLAYHFWERVGVNEPFPRRLRESLLYTLPLELVELPRLTLHQVHHWLNDRNADLQPPETDLSLCACLFAHGGEGIIFLNANDPDDEQTFSLAHEAAHFLRHYESPRDRAGQMLGSEILQVLDGKRPPRTDERLDAVLSGVSIGVHTHLLPRDPGGSRGRLDRLEWEADRLAWELLAPANDVHERVRRAPGRDPYRTAAAVLLTDFGLPVSQIGRYASLLYPPRKSDPLVAGLQKILQTVSNFDPGGGTT